MVDIVGLYSGITPIKGATAFSYFDLSTGGGHRTTHDVNGVRNLGQKVYELPKKTPTEFNNILNIDTLRGVLHKKGQDEAIRYGRPETSLTEGMYPKQGYARFQPKGLATNHNKPMDGPIMPIAGFYDPDMPNVLGGLPGK
jgi:hypothetical protein